MIVKYIFTAVIILVSLLVQGHPSFDVLRIAGVKPDLIFITVVYLSYCFGSFYGEVTAFIGGLFHDAVSNSPLGLLTLPKVAVAFIIGMFGRSLFKSNILTVWLLLFSATIVKGFLTIFLCYVFHEASASSILTIILPEAFYNALLAPPLFFIFDKIFERELEREGYL
ncbi:MAG: rod shape-determining protein MreD [Chrysiogenales bacterium]|nr:MAG: rod shape-determining protein MreD [Chrysiogenales bacterium]